MIFEDTSLDDIAKLGGMAPIGSGALGATIWTPTAPAAGVWNSTWLDNIAELGGMAPIGSGSLGATIWTVTND